METRTGESALQTASVQQSNALAQALKGLGRSRKMLILDLGSATGSNIRYFSNYNCRLYIEDIFDTLKRLDPGSKERHDELRIGRRMTFAAEERLDLILAWDLLNYLEAEEIRLMMKSLQPWCRTGTLMMALMSTRPKMPVEPLEFLILDSSHVKYGEASRVPRPSPRYMEPDLRKWMPGFEVDSSLLLRNGMLEYLFTYRSSE